MLQRYRLGQETITDAAIGTTLLFGINLRGQHVALQAHGRSHTEARQKTLGIVGSAICRAEELIRRGRA